MRPILVTGFAAFGEHLTNPSEQVVRALSAGAELVAEVLPVSYRRAEARLRALIEASEPRAMLPAEHASTLPLAAFAEALTGLSLPVVWSSDAGGFLCNHAYEDIQAAIGRVAVWQADCHGYYRSPSGRIVSQWPYSMSEFRERSSKPDQGAYEAAPGPRRGPASHSAFVRTRLRLFQIKNLR